MRDFAGRVVAVTGAGSGIGRALSIELARRGAHVAPSDVDEAGLAETVLRCEAHAVRVTPATVDVTDRAAVFAWADDVVERHRKVDVIVNNAGVALAATVEGQSVADVERIVDVDFWGVVHGTQAFLPHLRANGEGHVVNISSVFGLISVPGQSAYNAAKFAVRGYTDALRMELEIAGEGISSTTVHPGGVRTGIARSARVDETVSLIGGRVDGLVEEFDRLARTSPEAAARSILRAVERDRRRCTIGLDGALVDLVSRLPAGVHQRLLVASARRRLRHR